MSRRSERAATAGLRRAGAIWLALALSVAWTSAATAATDLAPPPVVEAPSAAGSEAGATPDGAPDDNVAPAGPGASAGASSTPGAPPAVAPESAPVALPVPGPFVPLDPQDGTPPAAPSAPTPAPATPPGQTDRPAAAPAPGNAPSPAPVAPSPAPPAAPDAVPAEPDTAPADRPAAAPPAPVPAEPGQTPAPAPSTPPGAPVPPNPPEEPTPSAPPSPAADTPPPPTPPAPATEALDAPAPPAPAGATTAPPDAAPITAAPAPDDSAKPPAAAAPAPAADDETPAAAQGSPADDAPPGPADTTPAPAERDAAPAPAEASKTIPAAEAIDPHDAALLAVAQDGGMGSAHLASACSPAAQELLDAALALLHAGHASAARAGFGLTADRDRLCVGALIGLALGYWAEGGGPKHLDAGRAALDAARELGAQDRLDAAWLEALGAYFDGGARSLSVRRSAFRERLRRMYADLPDDDDLAVLYALSLAHRAPAAPGAAPPSASEAARIAAAVLARKADHAGAARTVMRARASQGDLLGALQGAQAWMAAAPRAPGAALAAARLAARLGLYEAAAEHAGTARSLARELGLTTVEAAAGAARADAALQLCAVSAAQDALNGLVALDGAASAQAAWTQVALWLETRDWLAAARATPPPEPLLATALVLYGQAVGAARQGDPAATARAVERLDALQAPDPAVGQPLAVLRLAGRALATLATDPAGAIEAYDAAITLENGIGGTLIAPLPAAVLKGDALAALARPRDALAAYEHALTRFPNRRAALVGAYSAALALGEDARAQAYRDRLAPACQAVFTTPPAKGKR